jgi:hypothetical protein
MSIFCSKARLPEIGTFPKASSPNHLGTGFSWSSPSHEAITEMVLQF